jgi:hypothetical protein
LNTRPEEKVIDPFCGACGILTEAGLLGLRFEGYDIDSNILDDAVKNLEYYDIDSKHYTLEVKDSTKISGLKNIVTDLPYGKSSKKSDELVKLYSEFLANISGKAVVVMPDFMPYKSLLNKNLDKKLLVTDIIDNYVHKSLTRKIIVIDLKNTKLTNQKPKQRLIKQKVLKKNKNAKKINLKKQVKKNGSIKIRKKKLSIRSSSKRVSKNSYLKKKLNSKKKDLKKNFKKNKSYKPSNNISRKKSKILYYNSNTKSNKRIKNDHNISKNKNHKKYFKNIKNKKRITYFKNTQNNKNRKK